MTKDEERRVGKMLRAIVGAAHGCALSKEDAKKMKLHTGRLCDYCEEDVQEYMKRILTPND